MSRAAVSLRRVLFSLAMFLVVESVARGEHAVIKLEVTAPNGKQESFADHEPPVGGVYPRRRLRVKTGDPLTFQFLLTNTNPHKRIEGVVVRYFVVRTGSFDVKTVTDLSHDVVTQGTVKMNFKPDCRVGARLKFHLDDPGIYLVRIETQNTDSDHEHFSAIDLEAVPDLPR